MANKILAIDDDPGILALYVSIFNNIDNDFIVEFAEDGKEGLAKVKSFRPDIILLDEKIPIISGTELARKVRLNKELKYTPIIMITGDLTLTHKKYSIYETLVDDYIFKPFDINDLRAKVFVFMRIKKLTDDLAESKKKLILSEQLSSMGMLAATVAHEIRNPLTVMLGAIQDCKRADPCEKNIVLEQVQVKLLEINLILKQMLLFSKQITVSVESVNLEKSIKETLIFLKGKTQSANVSVFNQASLKINILADKIWFERILINLYKNAIEAMRNGGTLTIKDYEVGNYVAISISDTGKGISNEMLNKVFEPFHSSKKAGTGIGLSIVKKAIELQDGKIDFVTSPQGTTFTIQLPKFE
ncbi:MAG: ATP-binding protein [bacterium]